MNTFPTRKLAIALVIAQAIFPLTGHATDLSDVPMAVINSIKPNVTMTLDDSGSMQFEVIPESSQVYLTFPRPATLYGAGYYNYGTYDQIPKFADGTGNNHNRYTRCFRNAQCNPMYYDPTKRYMPWSNYDGTLMANATASAALNNPNNAGEGTFDLTTNQTYTRNWVNDNGTSTSGSLQFYPATFYFYTGNTPPTNGTTTNSDNNYIKVEIRPSGSGGFNGNSNNNANFITTTGNYIYKNASARTDCSVSGTTATCTYNQEIQNFANWYSYYRSRILAARAGIGKAFARQQPGTMRVAFGAINNGTISIDGVNNGTLERGVRLFSGTDRQNFFSDLYGHVMPASGTPLRLALDDVGQYFSRTDNAGPYGETPGSSSGTQFTCRQNFNILMTDGYWNGSAANYGTGNVDNTAGSQISRPACSGPGCPTPQNYTYTPGNPFNDSYSDTLADVAMHYWKNDLRPTLANEVPSDSVDPAFWQHLVNYTVGFGVTGTIAKSTIDSAFTANPQTINWPQPSQSNLPTLVDDLAHAAVNSRGGYFSAADPDTFSAALSSALDDVIGRNGSAAAVAVSNANVTSGDNASYASSYNSGNWTGDLQSYPLNLTTGVPDTSSPNWTTSAQAQITALSASNRRIATYAGSGYSDLLGTPTYTGVQFQAAGCGSGTCLSSTQQGRLATPYSPPGTADGAAVLAYLRGDRSGETSTYRARSGLLGDIINSEPVIIREPLAGYADLCYKNTDATACSNANSTYVAQQASRTKVIAQGANDGMLHLLNATTGAESWSYIPNALINMSDPSNSGTSALNMLSRRIGYQHKYFVDGTPVVGDVDFRNTDGATTGNPAWKTILVGGLGKGGRGYYALDVTTPTASSEANARQKVLWEFPNASTSFTGFSASNVGYTYGKPIITKTAAYGWVVIVTSGYNNGSGADNSGGDGVGYLWVLNARTGEILQQISTGVGTTGAPSGLAQIAAWVDNGNIDNTTTHIYGGDLEGNVWRFDLTDAVSPINYTVQRVAKLRSGNSTTSPAQPITTVPELGQANVAGVAKRYIYIGTGQYFGTTDVDTNQTQTMYGLIDDLSVPTSGDVIPDPIRGGSPAPLVQQTLTVSGNNRTGTSNAFTSLNKGWYIDLPGCSVGACTKGSERINTDPALANSVLIFTSNIPNSADPCAPGGSSYYNVVDYQTGGQVSGTSSVSDFLGNALASRPVLVKLPSGAIKALVRLSNATTVTKNVPPPPSGASAKRITWRELTE